jgi:uncharacterized protein (TIGR01319 family)
MHILTIEIGSTITKANAFRRQDGWFRHIGQGFAPTSVTEGDVGIGVAQATAGCRASVGPEFREDETFVNSSAAGGLRMTVHGLTYNMTARAAREASLGAGGIVTFLTAGPLGNTDVDEIVALKPNIVLLAGGVDYGERDIVWNNARRLAELRLGIPFIYAGNVALKKQILELFATAGIECTVAANVFPDIDILNVDPLRKIIQEMFSRHIIHAPGMTALARLTPHGILPTPGAVLRAAEIFAGVMGDVVVLDVGGATTDIHSVTEGSSEFAGLLIEPEPRAKRTVEGDLGVYVNASHILDLSDEEERKARKAEIRAIPETDRERDMTSWLCTRAVEAGVQRHAGVLSHVFTPTGRRQIVRGKDLSAVKWVVGTGGALTRISGGEAILRGICTGPAKYLLPKPSAEILIDRHYLFSALGTIAQKYPREVGNTFVKLWKSPKE